MYWKIRGFITEYIAILGPLIVGSVIVLYVASQFVPGLNDWIIKGSFFSVVIIALLVEVLGRLVKPESTLGVFSEWEEMRARTTTFIRERPPKKAELLEYSAWQIEWLLSELKRARSSVRILIAHPDQAVSEAEKRRIEDNLSTLSRNYAEYDVRLYRAPAGLRGRKIESLLILGWYTHAYENQELCIHGHENSIVVTQTYTREGKIFDEMFEKTFNALWNDENSIPLKSFERTNAARAVVSPP
jgi:hypothetical protein